LGKSALFLILVLLPCPAIAQRVQGDMSCTHTGTDLVYDCVFQLKRGGQPVSGLNVLVGADMPSMPMAHNIKPVKARPGKTAGEYLARLDLEMPGEWAVKLRLSGPVRDVLVLRHTFTKTGKSPRN
jgi:YtkA-like protein